MVLIGQLRAPAALTPGEKAHPPHYALTGCLDGARAGLHILENRQSIDFAGIRTLNRQALSLLPILAELSCLHFLIYAVTESLVSVF